MKRFLLASVVALVLVGATARQARANGRFPESNQLLFSKSDPDLVLLRVTFGLLVSHDRGKTFDYVCEQSIGYSGVEDPMYTVTPSGRVIASTFQGLTLTTDKACNWGLVGTPQPYIDLAANPVDGKDIIALSTVYKGADDAGNVQFVSNVVETKDEGTTFANIGESLDPTLLGHTIDFTTTDPNRIYITAVRYVTADPTGLLLTSIDRGTTWTEQVVPLMGAEKALFIAAVDPTDAEKVYLRTNNALDKPSRLIVREKAAQGDAGTGAFRTIYSSKAPLEGFALSPDGKKIWIGSPLDGILLANTTDYQFTQKAVVQAKCLALSEDGLWVCSNEANGFIAGISKDEGATFEPLLHFCTIRGPLACAEGSTTRSTCTDAWKMQLTAFGCEPDAGPDAGDAGVEPLTSPKSSSCDCQSVIPSSSWSTAGGTLACAIGALLAMVRRTRRRSR